MIVINLCINSLIRKIIKERFSIKVHTKLNSLICQETILMLLVGSGARPRVSPCLGLSEMTQIKKAAQSNNIEEVEMKALLYDRHHLTRTTTYVTHLHPKTCLLVKVVSLPPTLLHLPTNNKIPLRHPASPSTWSISVPLCLSRPLDPQTPSTRSISLLLLLTTPNLAHQNTQTKSLSL
jgi:hypothetical protein